MAPAKKKKAQKKRSKSERWPDELVRPNTWVELPKFLMKNTARLGLEPHHVWLVLFLQCERFRDRSPRYYWVEIARAAGRTTSTVRKWAYELRDRDLLSFGPGFEHDKKKKRARTEGAPRNDRNVFYLRRFEEFLVDQQEEFREQDAELKAQRRKKQRLA